MKTYLSIKKASIFFLSLVILSGCSSKIEQPKTELIDVPEKSIETVETTDYVNVKYRETSVNVADSAFEYLSTSKSSWIKGAWYDSDNEYMIINLDGIYYHYCEMPSSVWLMFKNSDSFGSNYYSMIKGNYDCRVNYMPTY